MHQERKDAADSPDPGPTPGATGKVVGLDTHPCGSKTEMVIGASRKVYPPHPVIVEPVPESGARDRDVNVEERLDYLQIQIQTGNSDVMDQLKKMDATTDMHHSAHLEQMEKAALERKQITAKLEQHTHTQREQVAQLQAAVKELQVAQKDPPTDIFADEAMENSQQKTPETGLQARSAGHGDPVGGRAQATATASPTIPMTTSGAKSPKRARSVTEHVSGRPHKRSNTEPPRRTIGETDAAAEGIRWSPQTTARADSTKSRTGGLLQSKEKANARRLKIQPKLD